MLEENPAQHTNKFWFYVSVLAEPFPKPDEAHYLQLAIPASAYQSLIELYFIKLHIIKLYFMNIN